MAAFLVLVGLGVLWLIGQAFEGASQVSSNIATRNREREAFKTKRDTEYNDRVVDTTKNLFERNRDIISKFESKVKTNPPETHSSSYGRYGRRYRSYSSPDSYYIENLTRDCLNEIALAENNFAVYPNATYLSNWRLSAPIEWNNLSEEIEKTLRLKQTNLKTEENEREELKREIARIDDVLKARVAKRKDPLSARKTQTRHEKEAMLVEDLEEILNPNPLKWSDEVAEYINTKTTVNKFPELDEWIDDKSYQALKDRIDGFNKLLEADAKVEQENKKYFSEILKGYKNGTKEDVIKYLDYVLDSLDLPTSIPKIWNIDFEPNEHIAIVEIGLPDVVHREVFKEVELKKGAVKKPLTQKEIKEHVPKIHPAIILKTAYEIFRNDDSSVVKLLVVNGWVEFDDPATGNKAKTYTASLAVEKEQINNLNLKKVEPLSAFTSLKGKSAGKLIDIIPVTPVLSLDRKDKRFIATQEVLNKLGAETNLASMDWQDFENLIAELFQREFAEEGTEVRLTQSSRDKGVDAIVNNPDPIRGGKYVIQAKRYTHTVDVSAVRDLVAVVAHEGASRGILVTTSTFGADAYAFVQNKPITLLDGAKLLGLLEKHGYKFKINLAEARKLLK